MSEYSKQAFPCYEQDGRGVQLTDAGMTLRDYFAAKAMQGFAADPNTSWDSTDRMADCAYKWADAMLKARGQ